MGAGWGAYAEGAPPLSAAGSSSVTGFCPKSGQVFPKVSQYMTNRNNHIKKAWQETDRATRAATIAMLITFAVFAAAFFFGGCSTTPAALSRDQRIYQTATNVVAAVSGVGNSLPPPFCSLFEGLTALAAAGLAGWNAWQHSQIKSLQNGSSTTTATSAPAAGSPTPGPAG